MYLQPQLILLHREVMSPPLHVCLVLQTFTTVHDGQTEVSILVLEGDFTQASRCNVLGQIDLTGLPSLPKGECEASLRKQ
jgi:molecular chaperone DnaK (HSP70)